MSLDKEPTLFRSKAQRGFGSQTPEVIEDGGQFKAGMIKNFSVIAVGEALGHGMWIDQEFADDVGRQLEMAAKGVKSRYTHPGQSGDALSKGLGRVTYSKGTDGKIRGDLHFHKAAHRSPDGDLAGFLMELATDDPESFGASIAFSRDVEMEEEFALDNPQSPDLANVDNLPHVRLGKLRFVDIVDDPAANPDGLFHKDDVFANADSLMEYALGLTDTKPEGNFFGVDADRLVGFTTRFLSNRNIEMKLNLENTGAEPQEALSLVDTIAEAPAEVEAVAEVAEVEVVAEAEVVEVEPVAEVEENVKGDGHTSPTNTKGAFKAGLSKYIECFGKELGLDYFMADKEFDVAMVEYVAKQKQEIAELKQKLEVEEATSSQDFSFGVESKTKNKGMAGKINLPS